MVMTAVTVLSGTRGDTISGARGSLLSLGDDDWCSVLGYPCSLTVL